MRACARTCVCVVCVFIITLVDCALPNFHHFDDVLHLNIRS